MKPNNTLISTLDGCAQPWVKMSADRAIQLVRRAVDDGRLPGASLGVVHPSGEVIAHCWGLAQREPHHEPLELDTFFDLASLTKVLFTVPEVLRAVEDGLTDLDDPIKTVLPELSWMRPTGLGGKTLRELLTHSAGLPAWAPIYTWGESPNTLKHRVLQEAWPLGDYVYSDIGFMLLGVILERLRGRALRDFPLPVGLTFSPEKEQAAATERCPWRGRVLRGEVDDENASALGGVAGHAGLFGTLHGVMNAARGLLNGTSLSPAALAELQQPHSPTRVLGWQRKHVGWSGGSLCSTRTIGHTGFTGTGCWIDFERAYAWVLLSNDVHPSRHTRSDINALRRAVGNAIAAQWSPTRGEATAPAK